MPPYSANRSMSASVLAPPSRRISGSARMITRLKQRFQFASEPANIDVWIAHISGGLFLDRQNAAKSSDSFRAAGLTCANSLDLTFLKRATAAPVTFLLDYRKRQTCVGGALIFLTVAPSLEAARYRACAALRT